MPATPDHEEKPLRLGVWCVVQSMEARGTILPNEGIGVFIYNLLNGLLELPRPPEVVLMIDPKEHYRVTPTLKLPRPNLRVLPPPEPWLPSFKDPSDVLKRATRVSDRVHARVGNVRLRLANVQRRVRGAARRGARWLLRASRRRQMMLLPLAVLLAPLICLAVWGMYALARFAVTTLLVLSAPLRWSDRLLHRLAKHPRFAPRDNLDTELTRLADEAACDIWIVPSIHCNAPRHLPSILFIHDLVTSHFPEIFERAFVDRVNRIAPRRAAEATLVACMSAFIRDTDLLGILQLPASKVRMVPSATPLDFPGLTSGEALSLKPSSLRRPYLFFPTAYRPYKNHRGLLKALRRLRDRHGDNSFDLVFTGGLPGIMPEDVQRLVDAYGFQNRVHALGGVDRKTLASLYRCAFATLVPSLYEQASYQITESLHFRCPVACSRIPPFLEQCRPMADAMLYFDPEDPESIAQAILQLRDRREEIREKQVAASQALFQRTWGQVATEWMAVFREGAELARQSRPAEEPEPAWTPPGQRTPTDPERLEVFLFLPTAYLGGVWEGTKNLMTALVEVNRRRRQLGLVLGVHENQADTAGLRRLKPDLHVEKLRFDQYTLCEARDHLGAGFVYPDSQRRERFCGWSGQRYSCFNADAWFALLDRFPFPLLPARPYGVWVYDMIQRYVPEFFGDEFFEKVVEKGMRPTLRNARVVVTTSPATQQDVLESYEMERSRLRLVPLACEPHQRFGALLPEPVVLPREPLLLYPSNAGGHKGAKLLLRAYARLRERLGDQTPLLVQCGTNSEAFSRDYQPQADDPPHWAATRALVRDLELEEGQDVVFLGFVNDRQLLDLYQRCQIVINASKYDNGSYSLVEGRYFGRPLVSTEYPAAVDLCQRFEVPARFFAVDDEAALANQMHQAMRDPILTGPALEEVRRRLADPEYGLERFAERVYDLLVELAREGRRQRLESREEGVVPCRGEAA